jgi:hypothetical protein
MSTEEEIKRNTSFHVPELDLSNLITHSFDMQFKPLQLAFEEIIDVMKDQRIKQDHTRDILIGLTNTENDAK